MQSPKNSGIAGTSNVNVILRSCRMYKHTTSRLFNIRKTELSIRKILNYLSAKLVLSVRKTESVRNFLHVGRACPSPANFRCELPHPKPHVSLPVPTSSSDNAY